MNQFILISVIALAIIAFIIIICIIIKKERDYDKANLGQVRVFTNGEAYIIEQYGMCGDYIDSWARYDRACEMVFFKNQRTSESKWIIPYYGWRSLNTKGNASMLGFGSTGTRVYEIRNKDLIEDIKSIALENFEKAKKQRDYMNKKWTEVGKDL